MRIVFAGFQHETNTFAPARADLRAFELGGGWPGLSRGPAVLEAIAGSNIPAWGFAEAAIAQGHELVPVLWCAASPSAHVTHDAYEQICEEILDGIRAALPVDAVYLDLHGAMVAEHIDDGEGELIRRVRAIIGPDVPLVASYDLHANMTAACFAGADLNVAYRTYPHVDMANTGQRAWALLADMLAVASARPAVAVRRIPFLIPICWQCTELEPASSLYARLRELETDPQVLSLSFAMGFPAADFPECGPVVWCHARGQEAADRAADALAHAVCEAESRFAGKLLDADDAVVQAIRIADADGGPVVIADTQDNPGAGAQSDTTGILRALIRHDARDAALGLIVDPDSAAAAHAAGQGAIVRLKLGGRSGAAGDAPLEADFLVEHLSDGRFEASGPYYGGFRMDLGPSACLRIGGVRIVVSSYKAQLADQAMFRFVGIEPTQCRVLVVKSTLHFRADFVGVARDILFCASPGAMSMDPRGLPWRRLAPAMRMAPGGPSFAQWQGAQRAVASKATG